MTLRYSLLGSLLAVLLAVAPPAAAQTYVASLSGANEVPAVVTAASGTVIATLGADGTTITVTGAFTGLESDYNAGIGSHIHQAAAGSNGGVIFTLTPTLDADNRGGTYEAANNTFTVSAAQISTLETDGFYVNIHSVANGSGEIRGQLGAAAGGLILTGVVDGPLTGGTPKAVEIYVTEDIADLSVYGLGSANNGGGTDGVEFAFPMESASAGDFLYVANEAPQFTAFFGVAPTYTSGAANINGNDAIELFYDPNGVTEAGPADVPATTVVVDVFGEVSVDGSGQPWDHMDGWAYRMDATGPDGSTFELGSWMFSGVDALDGAADNATATTPFPIGTYAPGTTGGGDPTARLQVIHNSPDPAAAVVDVYVNDALYLDDVPFRGASPFQNVPAGADLKVDIVAGTAADNSAPVFTATYNLPENTTAQLIATGVVGTGFEPNPDGVSTAFTLLASTDAQEMSMDAMMVAVRVVHGAPDAPTVDVRTGGDVLVDDAMYTDITGYLSVDPLAYTLDVTTADGSATVASYVADLSAAAGGAVTVLASGFLTPADDNDGPAFGLLAVFPDGTSALLPVVTTLADARRMGVGTAVSVTGVVTRTAGAFTYIQADGAALAIRQTSGDVFDAVADGTIVSGTELRVTGTLVEFANSLQISNEGLASYEILGTAPVPDPQVVTLAELAANGEAYEDELVTVLEVTIGAGDNTGGMFAPETTYAISDATDATGAVALRVPRAGDSTVDGEDVPPRANITAIAGQFNVDSPTAGYELLAIDADDIEALPAVASETRPDGTVVSLTVANPIRGSATVRFSAGTSTTATVALYDMLGRRVATLADGPVAGDEAVTLDASALAAGVYVLRMQAESVVLSETVTVVR